jgi:hypothetical protein
MTPGADVRSIPALREWLATLANYRSSAAEALAGIDMEIRRGFDWVAEQGQLWQQAVRKCEEDVVRAKHELAARKWPGPTDRPPDTTVQERNLRRAQARLEHAQEKVATCRAWLTRLPKQVDETYTGPSRRLSLFLDAELVRGMALLDRRVEALESYAQLRPDFAATPSAMPPPG